VVTASTPPVGQKRIEPITYGDLFKRLGTHIKRSGGHNPVHQAEWLLEFAQKDLTVCSNQEFASFSELFTIIGPWDEYDVQRVANQPTPQFDWIAPYTPTGLAEKSGIGLEEAIRSEGAMKESGKWFQHERQIVGEMYQTPVWKLFHGLLSFGQAVTDEIRLRLGLRKGALSPQSLPDPRSPHEIFIYRAAYIIQAVADRLVPCANPECHRGPHNRRKVFIQSRRDQTFCSEACSARIRMQRFREQSVRTVKRSMKRRDKRTRTKGGSRHGKK